MTALVIVVALNLLLAVALGLCSYQGHIIRGLIRTTRDALDTAALWRELYERSQEPPVPPSHEVRDYQERRTKE